MSGQGIFITFEGGEGSGKTTQIDLAAEHLRRLGREVVVTHEPGGSPGADALRHILLSGKARELGEETEAVLFAAARADHVSQLIQPALRDGKDVLCDRFHDSTRVYQGLSDGVDGDLLTRLEEAALQGLYPDLTIILDIPAEDGLARAAARRKEGDADRFEAESVELHERRRQVFLDIARAEPGRCRVVDASQEVDDVSREIALLLDDVVNAAGSPDS